jgi:hypothetical protein
MKVKYNGRLSQALVDEIHFKNVYLNYKRCVLMAFCAGVRHVRRWRMRVHESAKYNV